MPRLYAKGYRRRTVIIGPSSHKLHSCNRCGRKLWAGESVTITIEPPGDVVTYKHVGRTCPKLYNPRPL